MAAKRKESVATRPVAKTSAKRPRTEPERPSAYDEGLAERIRSLLAERNDVVEKKMFGGVCFMVAGRMCCGITREALIVRVGNSAFEAALAQPDTRIFDFTGRPSRGVVYVDPPGYRSEAQLERWLKLGLASEPPKARGKQRHARASAPRPRRLPKPS